MKILITGAFGNLGSHTLRELLRQGYEVNAFDVQTPRNEQVAAQFKGQIDVFWGDLRHAETIAPAVVGVDAILHLAAIIPPMSDENPDLARAVNIGGTRNIIEAARAQANPPRLFFASTFDLFGHTQHLPPPRKMGDPIEVHDVYTETKATCEQMVRESGLRWLMFRFSDMPLIALRDPAPIMYEIGLHNRFETMHPSDGALAVVNALKVDGLWGNERILLVGGGKNCQVTYRQFLFGLLTAMGIGALPDEAFTEADYVTDWLDTEESQRLLKYQRHTFDEIIAEVAALLGWKKYFVPLARPFVVRNILKLSRYYKKVETLTGFPVDRLTRSTP